jgi:hypothetical protein
MRAFVFGAAAFKGILGLGVALCTVSSGIICSVAAVFPLALFFVEVITHRKPVPEAEDYGFEN